MSAVLATWPLARLLGSAPLRTGDEPVAFYMFAFFHYAVAGVGVRF